MKMINKPAIEAAIRAQKWDKGSYAYALHAMDHYNALGFYPETFKKPEIIAEFWRLAETRFDRLERFTTFKNINPYIN